MIYEFYVTYYDDNAEFDADGSLMRFSIKREDLDLDLLKKWRNSSKKWSNSYNHENKREAEPDFWTDNLFHPILLPQTEGHIPDFIRAGSDFLFASTRAIDIMQKHGVNMQAFPASVQFAANQPPVSDMFMLYRLLDKEPVIDFEKTETHKDGFGLYYRNPVPTETFLHSDSVMAYDTTLPYAYVKQALKEVLENAGLLGCAFTPLDSVRRWPSRLDKPKQQPAPPPPPADNDDHILDLPAEITQEVQQCKAVAARNLGIALDADPKTLVEASANEVETLSQENLPQDDVIDFAISYGCLYGEQLVRQYGWVWRMVKYEGRAPELGVLSPDYAYVMHPTHYVRQFLADPDMPNTMILWFNMIGANDLPPKEKDGFAVLR